MQTIPARRGTGPRNLARLWETTMSRLGDHPSLYFEGAWHRSTGLVGRAMRFAAGLRGLGVRPGDRVVVLMANCPEVGITYHAIWRAGGVVTPVIFLVTPDELRHAAVDSGAVALVTTADLLPKVLPAIDGLSIPLVVVGPDGGDPARMIDFAEVEAAEPGPLVDRADDDLAALLYTGGTTGRSKGVPMTHANLYHAGAASRSSSYTPGLDLAITALPLSHAYGLLVTVGALHASQPGQTVLLRWFDPKNWLDLAAEHRSQVAAVVPSMLAMLLAQPLERYDLSALRHVYSGAAPLPAALRTEFERRVPSVRVFEGYGLTESSGLATATPPDRPRPGSVGLAVPGIEIRIVDLDGADLPPGREGEILLRGPNVTTGYWHDPEQTARTVTDGWLHTGDVGRLDGDGYLYLVDRLKDVIIRGGYNVYPRDVEEVLVRHPAVTGAAVVGRPDPRLGEEVVAFVTLAPGATATPEDLIAFAREHLAAHRYPREVRVVPALPLTAVGKLDRKALRRAIAAPAGAAG